MDAQINQKFGDNGLSCSAKVLTLVNEYISFGSVVNRLCDRPMWLRLVNLWISLGNKVRALLSKYK